MFYLRPDLLFIISAIYSIFIEYGIPSTCLALAYLLSYKPGIFAKLLCNSLFFVGITLIGILILRNIDFFLNGRRAADSSNIIKLLNQYKNPVFIPVFICLTILAIPTILLTPYK